MDFRAKLKMQENPYGCKERGIFEKFWKKAKKVVEKNVPFFRPTNHKKTKNFKEIKIKLKTEW